MKKHNLFIGILFFIILFFDHSCFMDPFGLLQDELDWKTYESKHFIYHYLDDDPDNILWHTQYELIDGSYWDAEGMDIDDIAKDYAEMYESGYDLLSDLFDAHPAEKISIYTYNNRAQKKLYGNGSAGAWIDYSEVNGDKYSISSNYGFQFHELVHIFQSCIGSSTVILMEGMAMAMSTTAEPLNYVTDNINIRITSHWTRSNIPSLATPQYPQATLPYCEYEENNIIRFYPSHMLAAMILGLYQHPVYPILEDSVNPNARPSNIIYMHERKQYNRQPRRLR